MKAGASTWARDLLKEYRVLIEMGTSGHFSSDYDSGIPRTIGSLSDTHEDVGLALEDLINDTTVGAPDVFTSASKVMCVRTDYRFAYVFDIEVPRLTARLA